MPSARRDLRMIMGDGVACSVMIGIGENYLAPFALALGMGEVVAGLIASVPLLAGAVLQLLTPLAIRRLGSHRRWVVTCVMCQAISFLPMAIAAAVGSIPVWLLFLLAAVYWGSGMASGPAWNSWVETLIPGRIRDSYFGRRTRFCQAATLIGFTGGGFWLAWGDLHGGPLTAFAVLFVAAAVCRFGSAAMLGRQSEPPHSRHVGGQLSLRAAFGRLRSESDGRLLIYLWAMQAGAQVASPFFTPFMLGELKFSYGKYMLIVSTSLAAKAIAAPTLGVLAQRFGARRLLLIGGVIVIPLPLLWIVSQAMTMLIAIQVLAGAAWATYELASFLILFEAIGSRERVGMLTLFNFGNAAATVAGSLIGGALLAAFGESYSGYMAVFAASALVRLATVPLLQTLKTKEDVRAKAELRRYHVAAKFERVFGSSAIEPKLDGSTTAR